jgi:predicted small secreted protein
MILAALAVSVTAVDSILEESVWQKEEMLRSVKNIMKKNDLIKGQWLSG